MEKEDQTQVEDKSHQIWTTPRWRTEVTKLGGGHELTASGGGGTASRGGARGGPSKAWRTAFPGGGPVGPQDLQLTVAILLQGAGVAKKEVKTKL